MERIDFSDLNSDRPLKGKKILLGVCGSIAAYKSVFLLRLLQKQGAEVQVIMTNNAKQFVTPLTFSTLSQNPVFSYLWHESTGNQDWSQHVQIAQKADLILIAPATMNTITKLACGICDDAVTATVFSASCPILIAPAMDKDMFNSPQNQKNLQTLQAFGYRILPTETGFLASGLYGEGRLLEPDIIVEQVLFTLTPKLLLNQNLLINVGPTQEPIDPVRFISNYSTGKMGIAIAKWAYRMGAQVTLIAGAITAEIPPIPIQVVRVQTANQMFQAMLEHFPKASIIIGTAAVADFKPQFSQNQKIKKIDNQEIINLVLTQNPDILLELGKQKKTHQKLVGFALETHNELENAKKKLLKKNLDWIVLNSTQEKGATFGHDTNKVYFISSNQVIETELLPKEQIAIQLLQIIASMH